MGKEKNIFSVISMDTDYAERTLQNVIENDGTLIIYFGDLFGGMQKTLEFCRQENKVHQLIDAKIINEIKASTLVLQFVQEHQITVLNVAGPRASSNPKGKLYTKCVIGKVLVQLLNSHVDRSLSGEH